MSSLTIPAAVARGQVVTIHGVDYQVNGYFTITKDHRPDDLVRRGLLTILGDPPGDVCPWCGHPPRPGQKRPIRSDMGVICNHTCHQLKENTTVTQPPGAPAQLPSKDLPVETIICPKGSAVHGPARRSLRLLRERKTGCATPGWWTSAPGPLQADGSWEWETQGGIADDVLDDKWVVVALPFGYELPESFEPDEYPVGTVFKSEKYRDQRRRLSHRKDGENGWWCDLWTPKRGWEKWAPGGGAGISDRVIASGTWVVDTDPPKDEPQAEASPPESYVPEPGVVVCLTNDVPKGWEFRRYPEGPWEVRNSLEVTGSNQRLVEARPPALNQADYVGKHLVSNKNGQNCGEILAVHLNVDGSVSHWVKPADGGVLPTTYTKNADSDRFRIE